MLGPVEIRVGDRVVPVGSRQQQLLLAALAVDAGHPVPLATLTGRLWDDPPDGARRTLYVLITRLRRTVEQAGGATPARVGRRGGGYALDIEPEQVDLLRFRGLLARARGAACTGDQRVALLRQAVALRRGEPLSGLAGSWAARARQQMREQQLDAVLAWARVEPPTPAWTPTPGS